MRTFIYLLVLAVFCFSSLPILAQTSAKSIEWNALDAKAKIAFAQKASEASLSGNARNLKVQERMKAFRELNYQVMKWTYKYFPDGDKNPSAGFLQSSFIIALYYDYGGIFDQALSLYRGQLSAMITELEKKKVPIPKYNNVEINRWVDTRARVLAQVKKMVIRVEDSFGGNIVRSSSDPEQNAMSRIETLLQDSLLTDYLAHDDQQQFIIKESARTVANAAANKNPSLWLPTYISQICKSLNVKLSQSSGPEFELYGLGLDKIVLQKLASRLGTNVKEIKERFSPKGNVDKISVIAFGKNIGNAQARYYFDKTEFLEHKMTIIDDTAGSLIQSTEIAADPAIEMFFIVKGEKK
ncbi:MAG: hypothetical protein V4687_16765 [Bacteroidota bacterium]